MTGSELLRWWRTPTTSSSARRLPSRDGQPRARLSTTCSPPAGKPASTASIPTGARVIRSAEQRASARVVGVERVSFLDYRDGILMYSLDLRRDLARAIRHSRPEVLLSINYRRSFGPGSLNHPDHRVVGEALLDATRDAANRWVFPELMTKGSSRGAGFASPAFNGVAGGRPFRRRHRLPRPRNRVAGRASRLPREPRAATLT